MRERGAANLVINGERLWGSLMEMAEIGATPSGGVCRLALSDEDKAGRDLFIRWCHAAGCTCHVDRMGNIFARRGGLDNELPPIMFGSHLDTVPTGGNFDGALGVLAGLEVMRTLEDLNYRTRAPLELVVWTNEEGSRFSPAMLSSAVFAGVIPIETAKARRDKNGLSFGEELERIGYCGQHEVGGRAPSAFIELHIEQGPILEREQKTIGVVTAVQALRWYEIRLSGQEAHAGTTPMDVRHDALLGAAEVILAVNAIACEAAADGRGTVGFIEATPNGRNVISGSVLLCVDLRHPDDAVLSKMGDSLSDAVLAAVSRHGLLVDFKEIVHTPAVIFDEGCISVVREAAERNNYSHRDIISGAGHDAVHLARVAPTAMIFVPCRAGLSHNEAEWATPDDCAAGCSVLLDAIVALDAT